MKKIAMLSATLLFAASVAHAESGSGQGKITVPLSVPVGNVCAYMPDPAYDIAGQNFLQDNDGYGKPVISGTYYATKDLTGYAQLKIRCTKDTSVKRSWDSTVKLTRSGSSDYLTVDVATTYQKIASAGGASGHLVPDVHQDDVTFLIKKGQWGVSKGTYTGNFVMTYDYQ